MSNRKTRARHNTTFCVYYSKPPHLGAVGSANKRAKGNCISGSSSPGVGRERERRREGEREGGREGEVGERERQRDRERERDGGRERWERERDRETERDREREGDRESRK